MALKTDPEALWGREGRGGSLKFKSSEVKGVKITCTPGIGCVFIEVMKSR